MNEKEPRKYTRREFVKLAGVVGGGAMIAGGSLLMGRRIFKGEQGIVLSDNVMDTTVSVSIFGKDKKEAERLAQLALSRMKTLEKSLTRFESTGAQLLLLFYGLK